MDRVESKVVLVAGDEEVTSLGGGADVTAVSSAPAVASAFFPVFKTFGFSLVILDKSSEWVPLTALETVSSVLLTRDMCWFKLANQRDAEVFKYKELVWRPRLCRD